MAYPSDTLALTAGILARVLENGRQNVQPDELPALIRDIRAALEETQDPSGAAAARAASPKADKRAVAQSITPDGLRSFIDGKRYKVLKRHLARHGMDLNAYRDHYGLPQDYPGVAPNYSAARSATSHARWLGARERAAQAASHPAHADKAEPDGAPDAASRDAPSRKTSG